MLTLPEITRREVTPYLALRAQVSLPFDDQLPAILDRLFATVAEHGLTISGPLFFKHDLVVMPELEMEFGLPVDRLIDPRAADIVSAELPAGRYAEITWFGRYDPLITVNAVLIGWAAHMGLTFDSWPDGRGERFGCRLEIYHNSPGEEPEPEKWQTTVAIRLKE
ncbi:GyrI-like domain-containing protein [Szabonella alba]|uniref:AraC effector-binding domain-containing protein n=1 Tax=Szabonella alba TaxID=2804194 RepID=A0A8K0VAC6_9RHOB|nr:GyrI-like domain-containing protein [Szabonella alba]MBL4918263.1 hypothetical protein [Szabonella alba]